MQETYEERRERERWETDYNARGPGHETYEEQLERYRRGWDEDDYL